MARLTVRAEELVVRLSWWEKILARRRNVHLPLEAVESVEADPSWWRALRGTPGRGVWIPDVLCLGVRKAAGARDFVALRPRQGGVVSVDLSPMSAAFARVAVSDRIPDGTAATLRTALSRVRGAPPGRPGREPEGGPSGTSTPEGGPGAP
ncbi:hypothetical protein AB0M38_21485 [Streptomyces sp. NPDC051742]|uniref:hypothetical protein n=1 Tax=unclassified Streptomyces TaxID=2593676 RepID=UPI0034387054